MINAPRSVYIMLHIEKVIAAGTNKFGYISESSPVPIPLSGRADARTLKTIITRNPARFIMDHNFL